MNSRDELKWACDAISLVLVFVGLFLMVATVVGVRSVERTVPLLVLALICITVGASVGVYRLSKFD